MNRHRTVLYAGIGVLVSLISIVALAFAAGMSEPEPEPVAAAHCGLHHHATYHNGRWRIVCIPAAVRPLFISVYAREATR